MLPLCAAPLASENPCDLSAKVFRDPHINFAYGGSADLRGRHNALYNFLSAPGLSVNVKTEEALFKIHDGALTVNGSFLTEAHVVARVYSRYTAEASFFASQLSDNNWGWSVVNGTCAGRPFRFGKHGGKKCFALEIAMDHSSATFSLPLWTITVHGMRSVPRAEDHLAGPKHRLDVGFSARGDAPSRDRPHGIIGQSYATPGLERHGKKDVYPWAGQYTTGAQAEGAIEGTVSDYTMHNAYATEYAFSRFNAPRDVPSSVEGANANSVVDASSIDRVANPDTEAQRRRLSEAPCPPPPTTASASSPPPAPTAAASSPPPAPAASPPPAAAASPPPAETASPPPAPPAVEPCEIGSPMYCSGSRVPDADFENTDGSKPTTIEECATLYLASTPDACGTHLVMKSSDGSCGCCPPSNDASNPRALSGWTLFTASPCLPPPPPGPPAPTPPSPLPPAADTGAATGTYGNAAAMAEAGFEMEGCDSTQVSGNMQTGIWCPRQESLKMHVPLAGGPSTCTATFTNSNEEGRFGNHWVRLLLNGEILAEAGNMQTKTVTFDFKDGDDVVLQEGYAVMKFAADWIKCT